MGEKDETVPMGKGKGRYDGPNDCNKPCEKRKFESTPQRTPEWQGTWSDHDGFKAEMWNSASFKGNLPGCVVPDPTAELQPNLEPSQHFLQCTPLVS